MEIIAELILGFILEILLPLAAELSLDILWRSLGEPFVAREFELSSLIKFSCIGGIGAHIGAALLFGHRHADCDAPLLFPRGEPGVVGGGKDLWPPFRCNIGLT